MIGPRTRGGIPPQLGAPELRALALERADWWTSAGPLDVTVERLGRGESYTAWLLRRGPEELVARVPHAGLEELPLPPAAELDMLRRIPEDLGARPVAALEGTAEDPRVVVVTSRVPGRMLPAADWTDPDLLVAHARALAALHEHGDATEMAAPGRIDPASAAQDARDWWREHEAEAAAEVIDPLWDAALRRFEHARPAFRDIEPVLLHGDPAAANCLVDGKGTVRFVDWEWAQRGDPARDLAFLGGPLHAEPWYAPLDPDLVRRHAEAYLAARPHAALELPALLRRREAHLLHECLFTAAHLHRVAAAGGPEAEPAARTSATLREQIAALCA